MTMIAVAAAQLSQFRLRSDGWAVRAPSELCPSRLSSHYMLLPVWCKAISLGVTSVLLSREGWVLSKFTVPYTCPFE